MNVCVCEAAECTVCTSVCVCMNVCTCVCVCVCGCGRAGPTLHVPLAQRPLHAASPLRSSTLRTWDPPSAPRPWLSDCSLCQRAAPLPAVLRAEIFLCLQDTDETPVLPDRSQPGINIASSSKT